MIKLLTKQTLELYKLKHLDPLTFLNHNDIDELISICCTINLLEDVKTIYCLDITLQKDYLLFIESYMPQELNSLGKCKNLLLIIDDKKISKLEKTHSNYYCIIDLIPDKEHILFSYFEEKHICVARTTIAFLLDSYDDDIFAVVNDIYIAYLANPEKEVNIALKSEGGNIFTTIDTLIARPQSINDQFLIKQIATPKEFLGFLSLLEKKLELIMLLKLLTQNYTLKDISILINKNIYYLKSSLALANTVSIYRVTNLIHVISDIDYKYKHGLINEENSVIRILS